MIDTVNIVCAIDEDTFNSLASYSTVKTAINCHSDLVLYSIFTDKVEGSYSSNLNVKIGSGVKYNFFDEVFHFYISIEGSYHKISKGYNSHNGFYDLEFIIRSMINLVECNYNIQLPDYNFWLLYRCDIAICFDLGNQENVKSYINSLSRCNYPRRKMKFYTDESLYLSGTTTTLKIYNKLMEFKKHDLKKFYNTDFNLENYINEINGFVRFECEIHKKKLNDLFNNKEVYCKEVNYDILKNVWSDEFMKLLKFIENDLEIVRGREHVLERLKSLYKPRLVNVLFNFYCSIQLNGVKDVQKYLSESTYYRNLKFLKEAKIDISQCYRVEECNFYCFNPFTSKEVA